MEQLGGTIERAWMARFRGNSVKNECRPRELRAEYFTLCVLVCVQLTQRCITFTFTDISDFWAAPQGRRPIPSTTVAMSSSASHPTDVVRKSFEDGPWGSR
ncbi:hypothetical protein Bpfe_027341 [Biomphalaria pfeifferi]|uniref:Uncharacterized protein n=1 Tax=Biomphalaria pfeifferi TaxID=112525 RepID=A0AAD8EWQ2_BIOPF|nr:hypothetical protein Bpfe_027341 [Biomphalaria pfeifferi]